MLNDSPRLDPQNSIVPQHFKKPLTGLSFSAFIVFIDPIGIFMDFQRNGSGKVLSKFLHQR